MSRRFLFAGRICRGDFGILFKALLTPETNHEPINWTQYFRAADKHAHA